MLVGQAIGDLFESPAKVVGIQVEAEEEMMRYDRENMVAGNPLPVGMTESYLEDWVGTT